MTYPSQATNTARAVASANPYVTVLFMDLVSYLRVSTDKQVDGYGLDNQRADIAKWCKVNGHRIVAEYVDAGVSGTLDPAERLGLRQALDDLCPPPLARGLVVARLDRLARSLTVQEACLQIAWQAGGSVFTVDAGEILADDEDDPMRTAIRQMAGVFAQLDRASLKKRLRAGRRAHMAKGNFGGGVPPLGLKAVEGKLVPDESEQETVTRIMELRNAGASYREIGAVLESEGRKTKRGGTRWTPPTVARIVDRMEGR
jgi:DNA invertase Pin-like site-specific DNA recombinase